MGCEGWGGGGETVLRVHVPWQEAIHAWFPQQPWCGCVMDCNVTLTKIVVLHTNTNNMQRNVWNAPTAVSDGGQAPLCPSS